MSSITNITSDISTMKLFDIGKVNLTNRKNFSSNFYIYNNRDENEMDNSIAIITAGVGAVPEIYIWGFLATILSIGFILNILAIYTLCCAKASGTRYFLLQLTFCDIGSLLYCGLELFYINYQKWFMPPELCPIYLGLESFISTATIYFIIAINLHALSTYNLAIETINKTITESDEYDPLTINSLSNQQELNTNNDDYEIAISIPTQIHQSTRSLTIDYSKKKNDISIIMPTLFIWFISASISIPLIVFGKLIPNDLNPKICGIMNFDWYSTYVMQGFILGIRLFIPISCLLITMIFILIKLINNQNNNIELNCKLNENIKVILKLSFCLTLIIIIFSIQKIFGSLLFELITKPFMHYRYPKMNSLMALLMSGWSFLGSILRPIIYYCMDNELKNIFCKTKRKRLHHLMDDSELEYYFNTNILNLPAYDVIDLKNIQINKRTKRHISESINDNNLYSLKFNAFNRPIHLKLKPNENLISKNLKIWIHDGNKRKILNENNFGDNFEFKNCYYLHRDGNSVASLNNCEDNRKYHGIILTSNDTLEILPLNNRLQRELQKQNGNQLNNFESAHIIKRVKAPEIIPNLSRLKRSIEPLQNSYQNLTDSLSIEIPNDDQNPEGRIIQKQNVRYTVELGVFFDEPAYKIFSPLFNRDDRKLAEMLLAYMNGVQALYHHNSLGTAIDITIVHLEIMRRQPPSLPHHNGERDLLLDSFCLYQQRINPPTDDDSGHWDMGLYISGLDFYSNSDGAQSGATMGLATVRGVCSDKYACVIVEFGATNAFGRPYPSAGFNSIYISAHEIGHNLGMSHDSTGNYCPKDGFIMSPSRGTQGETIWSSCSADVIRSLGTWATCLNDRPKNTPEAYNAWRNLGYPGQKWSAKKQCEILIADVDAMPMQTTNLEGICQNLECRSPHKSGFFFAGPALEGTDCGVNNWCEGGNCVYKTRLPNAGPVVVGGMGPWRNEKCVSGCLVKSTGGQGRRRACDNPKPKNTVEGCEGTTYDVTLCSDAKICQNVKRKTPVQFASRKCKQFSKKIPDLDSNGVGLQAHHESNRLWMGCAIFCRRRGGSFYSPRMNLNEIGENAYFPDGTWCHSVNNENYYCMQHHCLPEGFQFNKNNFWLLSEDVPISGNANPNFTQIYNKKLIDYLSIDENGKALRAHLTPDDVREQRGNEQWIDDLDYRIVPSLFYRSKDLMG